MLGPTSSATASRRREEQALFERLRAGDTSVRRVLVTRFLPLAHKLARTVRGGDDLEDLEQVAVLGLIKAIDRFDPGRGFVFTTFAIPTITGELKRHFRDRGWSVRVPRPVLELAMRIEFVSSVLTHELGRSPTVTEIGQRADCSHEQVIDALHALSARHAVSLDQSSHGSDEPDWDITCEEPGYATVENAAVIDALLSRLPARDRLIIELRFREDRTQCEIAKTMGLSQMQVSRVVRGSIDSLAEAIAA